MLRTVHCLLLALYLGHTVTAQSSTPCVTPDRMGGACVPIEQCQRIKWLLGNWQAPYPQFVVDYLRTSHCGTQGQTQFACCASYDIIQSWPAAHPIVHSAHWHHSHQVPPPGPLGRLWAAPSMPVGEEILNRMPCGSYSGLRIANGEAVDVSELPWMVLLEYNVKRRRRFQCAGSLITDRYVLTAAHCVARREELVGVRLGEHDLNEAVDCGANAYCAPPFEDVGVERAIVHPHYSSKSLSNDIALLRLQRSVQFQTHIQPICLHRMAQFGRDIPTLLQIAGWGETERGYAADTPLKAQVPLQDGDYCQQKYPLSLAMTADLICAGGVERRSTCRGDSGGPLYAARQLPSSVENVHYVQYGIISAGDARCGSKRNLPGVFTRVAAYMDWIVANLEW